MECRDDIGGREHEGDVTLNDVLDAAPTMRQLILDNEFIPTDYSIEVTTADDWQVVFSGSTAISQLTQFSFYLKGGNIRWILPSKGGSVCNMNYWREMYEALLADFQRVSELFRVSEEAVSD